MVTFVFLDGNMTGHINGNNILRPPDNDSTGVCDGNMNGNMNCNILTRPPDDGNNGISRW